MKALDCLYRIKQANEEMGFEPNNIIEAIEEPEELETKDRLAELEKVILDYYLARGYQVGVGGWGFKVNISTYHKDKEIQIMFRKDRGFNYETVFRRWKTTTKEMFNEAFEHFSIKEWLK